MALPAGSVTCVIRFAPSLWKVTLLPLECAIPAGVIVTEYGVADLRGLSLARRRERMIAIAHPDHRAALDRMEDKT